MSKSTNIRIAQQMARELEFEVDDAEKTIKAVEKAMADGTSLVWIADSKGNRHGIATDKIAFIEVEGEESASGVGFGVGP